MNRLLALAFLQFLAACQPAGHKEEQLFDGNAEKKDGKRVEMQGQQRVFRTSGTWTAEAVSNGTGKSIKLTVTGKIPLTHPAPRLRKQNRSLNDTVLVLALSVQPNLCDAEIRTITYKENLIHADQYKTVKIMFGDKLVSFIEPIRISQ